MKARSAEAARLEADYLARVKAAIAGRDPSEVDEIIESLREHVEEELSETADDEVTLVQMANVLERLGLPETYVQEGGGMQRTEVAARDEERPKLSKLAIAAALCFPVALLFGVLVGVLSGNTDTWEVACAEAMAFCSSVALIGLLLGIAAIVVIYNSRQKRQKLRGYAFAWIGVLTIPLLLVLAATLVMFLRFSVETPLDESHTERKEQGEFIPPSSSPPPPEDSGSEDLGSERH